MDILLFTRWGICKRFTETITLGLNQQIERILAGCWLTLTPQLMSFRCCTNAADYD